MDRTKLVQHKRQKLLNKKDTGIAERDIFICRAGALGQPVHVVHIARRVVCDRGTNLLTNRRFGKLYFSIIAIRLWAYEPAADDVQRSSWL